jgi:hypothetical protein
LGIIPLILQLYSEKLNSPFKTWGIVTLECLPLSINDQYSCVSFRQEGLGYRLNDREFESRQEVGIFLFTTESRPALRPTQPAIQWVRVALTLGLKRPGGEADHSPPSSAEVKNVYTYTSIPQYAFVAWRSFKAKGQLYLMV